MRISKLAHQYLQDALKKAKRDRQKLEDELKAYLAPVHDGEDARKILKMKEDGFDLFKNTDDRVALDMAIADLHNILYYNEARNL